jgi:hypothetical protein
MDKCQNTFDTSLFDSNLILLTPDFYVDHRGHDLVEGGLAPFNPKGSASVDHRDHELVDYINMLCYLGQYKKAALIATEKHMRLPDSAKKALHKKERRRPIGK